MGLSALIVGGVAFLFAIIPFLSFVAWLPALAAIVLGIVGLVLKNRKRGLALAGLIVGAVAWIVAIIVSLAGVAGVVNAIDEEISSSVAPADPAAPSDEASQAAQEEPVAAEAGSRENPVPLGSTIESADWTVVVNSYNADATTAVSGANQFNQPAPDGSTYAIVNYTVTYKGEDSGYANFVQVKLVTDSGEVLDDFTNPVVLEDGFSLDELYAGGTATGSAAFAVPNGTPVLIRVTPGVVAEDKFVQP